MQSVSVLLVVVVVAALTDSVPMAAASTRLQRNPQGNLPVRNTGAFTGTQQGNALTKVKSMTDTRSGLTNTGLSGVLSNSGQLRGAANAQNERGNAAASQYTGDLAGTGGMFADTKTLASDFGAASRTDVKGFMGGTGAISGSVGGGRQG